MRQMMQGLRGAFTAAAGWAAIACSPAETREAPLPPAGAARAAAPDTAPDPLRPDSAGRAWVEAQLAGMSLRQRVSQLVFPWISGRAAAAVPEEHRRLLRWAGEDGVGGLIVSTGAPAALAARLNAAQGRAAVPLLVLSDLETGPGMRLSPGGTRMPPAMAFGAAADTALARAAGRATAAEARAVGIHATLGPMLDVQTDPANPIVNVRAFGGTPERVAALGTAWMAGAREGGLLVIAKHFPGHGATRTDSHVGRTAVPGDMARLRAVELVPFARAVGAGVDGILVGHIAVPGVEGPEAPPASLSPRITRGLLREEMGFRGLVVTDALNMGAVTRPYSVAEASIRALLAGADVLLQPPGGAAVVDAIVAAVDAGRIPAARIEEAARRVLSAKAVAGLHRGARVDGAAVAGRVGTAEHRQVARQVAERSVVVARDARCLLPLRPGTRILHVTYTGGSAGGTLHAALVGAGLRGAHVRVGAGTSAAAYAALRQRAREAQVVVASAEVAPFQYRALGLSGGFASFVQGLAAEGAPVVAVSLGSPYIGSSFPEVPALVLAWSTLAVSERAAGGVITGSLPARGQLPVPEIGVPTGTGAGCPRAAE